MVYDGVGWSKLDSVQGEGGEGGVPRAGIVVASQVSPDNLKAGADYICTGIDDEVIINQAITDAFVEGVGGTVILLGGQYSLSDSIISKKGVDIIGMGGLKAKLNWNDNPSTEKSTINITNHDGFIKLENIYFGGYNANVVSAIDIYEAGHLIIKDCQISGFETGINIGVAFSSTIQNCEFNGSAAPNPATGILIGEEAENLQIVFNQFRFLTNGINGGPYSCGGTLIGNMFNSGNVTNPLIGETDGLTQAGNSGIGV